MDTGGQHWGKVIWHAYEHLQVPVSETDFRDAYVHAERTLGKNPIIQPDSTFYKTLETKIRLQLEYLQTSYITLLTSYILPLTSHLYEATVAETSKSREVLLSLKKQYPMVLVSNFYGNIATVLKEFKLDGIFDTIIESAGEGWTNDPVDESPAGKVITDLTQLLVNSE